MVRDGPAQEALSGAEGHQAESGLPKRPCAPLSHEELIYSHSLHLSSLGDPGLHGIGELSPQLGEDPRACVLSPKGRTVAVGAITAGNRGHSVCSFRLALGSHCPGLSGHGADAQAGACAWWASPVHTQA